MECKTFEIRDKATFVTMMAIRLWPSNEADRYLLARSGYGRQAEAQGEYILLGRLEGGENLKFNCDPHNWGGRTFPVAHEYIIQNWSELVSGQVIDVEFILGEKLQPKKSESEECPL